MSGDLTLRHGNGFSRSNVIRIRQFYLAYPKGATASHLLSWSHWVELLKLDDPLERSFYEQQTVREKWAVRELQRQKKSSIFASGEPTGHASCRHFRTVRENGAREVARNIALDNLDAMQA